MNVYDLKQILEGMDDDVEVRWAAQPAWPFEYDIHDAVEIELDEDEDDEDEDEDSEGCDCGCPGCDCDSDKKKKVKKKVLYLTEGDQLGYLPTQVSKEIGWK
jgi:hypothetical protein